MSAKTVLGLGQSRALITAALREGLLETTDKHPFPQLEIAPSLQRKAFQQLLLSDEAHLQLDAHTCEFNYAGNLIDSGRIQLLPYHRPDRREADPNLLFESLSGMCRFLAANGFHISEEEVQRRFTELFSLERVYVDRFGDKPLHRVQLNHFITKATGRSALSSADELLLEQYARALELPRNILSHCQRFQNQVDEAARLSGVASFDFDLASAFAVEDRAPPQIDPQIARVLGPDQKSETLQTVMMEIGSLPYRHTLQDTLALDASSQMRELRSYVKALASRLERGDAEMAEAIAADVAHAKGELRNAGREDSLSAICTFIGVPLAALPYFVPALSVAFSSIGLGVTLLGAYAVASGLNLRRQYHWASIASA
jgi:hypothetical protein